MRRHVMGRLAVMTALVLTLALPGGSVRAATWADPLFGRLSHDFGPVPRGAKVHHAFTFTNRLAEPVTILDVRASCGCTTGRASAKLVPAGGSATLDAEMDTRNFVGKKATVLTVSLVTASGREAEVRLGVASTILSDIVLNPGTIDLGTVTRGQTPTLTLTIERVGAPGWQALRMVSGCRAIDATLTETVRDGRSVAYLLKVSLRPDAPAGNLRDEIRVVTNDAESPIIPVQVTAAVRGELSASPSVLGLGKVSSAGGVKGRFLVRASRPFTVRAVEGEGDGFRAEADNSEAKTVHVLTVSYRPEEGKARGDLRRVFRLHTDLIGEPPLELTATLHVDP
jgi:hypothetical protein